MARMYVPLQANQTCTIPDNSSTSTGGTIVWKNIPTLITNIVNVITSSHINSGYPSIKFYDTNGQVITEWIFSTAVIRDTQLGLINAYSSATLPKIAFKIGDGNPLTPANGTTDYANPIMKNLPDASSTLEVYYSNHTFGSNSARFLTYGTDYDLSVVGGGIHLKGGLTFITSDSFAITFD